MSDPILPLLVGILAALSIVGAVASLVARGSRQAIGFAGTGLGGLGFLLTLLSLFLGHDADSITFPFGLPGLPLRLTLDPLASFFLLPAFLAGSAGIAFAAETEDTTPKSSLAGLALSLTGVALATLAADGTTLALGLSLAGGAIWASGEHGRARALQLGVTGLAALAVLAANGLSGAPTVAYCLILIGPGALAGLVPFHLWSVPAHRAAPARAAALLSGAMPPLAIYLLLRLLLDLGGPAPPLWWGVPLLLLGACTALTGGWRAASEAEIGSCLAGLTERQSGLAAMGIGLALIGRASDLPNLTVLSEEAVLLLALSQAVCGTLAQLAAGAVRSEAGTRQLVLLGGLIHSMPSATVGMGAALYGFSVLPAGAGFAALWLLFQALLAAPRIPGLALVAAVLAISATLSGVALVRVFGVAFLGRPRGPRSAAALDIVKTARPGMLVLAGIAMLIGLFPGTALMLAGPAIRHLEGTALEDRVGVLGLSGYPVLPLVLLGLAVCGAVVWLLRRRGGAAPRLSPAWNGGFAPTPPWLPFGDPLTQSAGAGFLPMLPRLPRLRRRWRMTRVALLPVLLTAMGMLLAILLWTGAA